MASPTSGAGSARKSNKKKKGHRSKTTWGPGQSGNRKGRPQKGSTYAEIVQMKSEANDIKLSSGEKISRKEAVVEKLYSKAIQDGDMTAIRMLLEMDTALPGSDEAAQGATLVQVFAYFKTVVYRATVEHPEVRERIVKELEASQSADEQGKPWRPGL